MKPSIKFELLTPDTYKLGDKLPLGLYYYVDCSAQGVLLLDIKLRHLLQQEDEVYAGLRSTFNSNWTQEELIAADVKPLTQAKMDQLMGQDINLIRKMPNSSVVVWGNRLSNGYSLPLLKTFFEYIVELVQTLNSRLKGREDSHYDTLICESLHMIIGPGDRTRVVHFSKVESNYLIRFGDYIGNHVEWAATVSNTGVVELRPQFQAMYIAMYGDQDGN